MMEFGLQLTRTGFCASFGCFFSLLTNGGGGWGGNNNLMSSTTALIIKYYSNSETQKYLLALRASMNVKLP